MADMDYDAKNGNCNDENYEGGGGHGSNNIHGNAELICVTSSSSKGLGSFFCTMTYL